MQFAHGTWLDPEKYACPSGSLTHSKRRAAALCSDGVIRIARVGIADTWVSIPASVRVRRKTVSGYVMVDSCTNVLIFRPYDYDWNAGLLPP